MSEPSKEALEAAQAWLERYDEDEVELTDDDLALALDAFAKQARNQALEEAAQIAKRERGQIAGCPERDDLCDDLAKRYRALKSPAKETSGE